MHVGEPVRRVRHIVYPLSQHHIRMGDYHMAQRMSWRKLNARMTGNPGINPRLTIRGDRGAFAQEEPPAPGSGVPGSGSGADAGIGHSCVTTVVTRLQRQNMICPERLNGLWDLPGGVAVTPDQGLSGEAGRGVLSRKRLEPALPGASREPAAIFNCLRPPF